MHHTKIMKKLKVENNYKTQSTVRHNATVNDEANERFRNMPC